MSLLALMAAANASSEPRGPPARLALGLGTKPSCRGFETQAVREDEARGDGNDRDGGCDGAVTFGVRLGVAGGRGRSA